MSKIIELTAENVKRLKAICIRPDSSTVCIGGKNGAGKSSTLDCIGMALGGKDDIPGRPIRAGESAAKIIITTDDITVTRSFTASGSYLTVSSKDGAKYSNPQTMLDKLVGPQIDPMAFSRLAPAAQAAQLRTLLGIDTAKLDAERARVFEARRVLNAEAKSLAGAVASAPSYADAPTAEVSISALAEEMNRRNAVNADIARRREAARQLSVLADGAVSRLDMLNTQIEEAAARLESMRQTAIEDRAKLATAKTRAAEAVADVAGMAEADTAEISAKMKSAEADNAKFRANIEREKLESRQKAKAQEATKLTARLDAIDAEKAAALAGVEMPLDSLGMDDTGVTFGGIPLDQASSAEKIRVGVALALAMNRGLRVLRIYDGSLLDDENLAMIHAMAEAADAQIWIERVGEGEEISVVIEDGEVKK